MIKSLMKVIKLFLRGCFRISQATFHSEDGWAEINSQLISMYL